jgi:aminoglycoside phosphotransferase
MLDLDADPADAAALFERAAPDLGEPTAVWFDGGPEDDVFRWRVRSTAGAFRLKVATSALGSGRLRTGAAVLAAVGRAGLPVPRVVRFADAPTDGAAAVLVETRGLDRDAALEWPRLVRPGREAVVDRWAEALANLHRLPPSRAGLEPAPGCAARDVRLLLVTEIADALDAPRSRRLLPESFLERVEVRLCGLVDAMPPGVAAAPCHGASSLSSVLLERRAFAALRDFERARVGDPASDLARAALALGDPGGPLARRLVTAYRSAVGPAPAGAGGSVEARIRLHVGIDLVRAVSLAAADSPPEVVAAILDGLESWLDEPR